MQPEVFVPPSPPSSERQSAFVPPVNSSNPYAAPQTIKHLPPVVSLSVIGQVLGVGAWLLFLVSLILPAARPDLGAWNNAEAKSLPGYMCALLYWPYYPSNLCMATLPLWLWTSLSWRAPRWACYLIMGLLLLSGIGAWVIALDLYRADSGCWLWVASFFPATLAILLCTVSRE